jgi:hypothetical protein
MNTTEETVIPWTDVTTSVSPGYWQQKADLAHALLNDSHPVHLDESQGKPIQLTQDKLLSMSGSKELMLIREMA